MMMELMVNGHSRQRQKRYQRVSASRLVWVSDVEVERSTTVIYYTGSVYTSARQLVFVQSRTHWNGSEDSGLEIHISIPGTRLRSVRPTYVSIVDAGRCRERFLEKVDDDR